MIRSLIFGGISGAIVGFFLGACFGFVAGARDDSNPLGAAIFLGVLSCVLGAIIGGAAGTTTYPACHLLKQWNLVRASIGLSAGIAVGVAMCCWYHVSENGRMGTGTFAYVLILVASILGSLAVVVDTVYHPKL